MKILGNYLLPLIVGTSLLAGCAGYDRALFVTKTNVGLDIEDQPPTAEITIARRELAIAPTYRDTIDGKKTLPLLASFGITGNFFNPEITSHFAGGDAAVTLARGEEDPKSNNGSSLCLDTEPDTRPFYKRWFGIKEEKDNTRPFFFATDTSFGLKLAWSGTGGPYPTNLKLGYNRKELAFPPIFVKKVNKDDVDGCPKDNWQVKVPSFFASLGNSTRANSLTESGVTHVQFFATGLAASEFAKRPSVNRIAFEKMAPEAANLAQLYRDVNLAQLNRELFGRIEEKYGQVDDTKKQNILDEAIRLTLVSGETNTNTFISMLKETAESSVISEVPVKLMKLRKFVEKV